MLPAHVRFAQGRFADALPLARQTLDGSSNSIEIEGALLVGRCLIKLGRTEAAIREVEALWKRLGDGRLRTLLDELRGKAE